MVFLGNGGKESGLRTASDRGTSPGDGVEGHTAPRLPGFQAAAQAVLETLSTWVPGKVILIDADEEARRASGVIEAGAEGGSAPGDGVIGSYIAVPVPLSDGSHAGTLYAFADDPDRYDDAHRDLLTTMARLLGYGLDGEKHEVDLQQLNRQLREQAMTDPLTGVANRRSFLVALEREWQLAKRGTVSSYLVVADLDGLKAVNDRFGHSVGDVLLKDACQALEHATRETDIVGRLGGDELGVLLLGCESRADAGAFCDRARQRLESLSGGRPARIGISVGFHSLSDSPSAGHALDLADQAMYRDKLGPHAYRAPDNASPASVPDGSPASVPDPSPEAISVRSASSDPERFSVDRDAER